MSVESIYRWRGSELEALEYCDMTETRTIVADSWLVSEGRALGLDLHRSRFFDSIPADATQQHDIDAFWNAAIATIPREGDWFPRVELHARSGGYRLVFRLRSAPERKRSAVLATWTGTDPRTTPRVKGPDLEALSRVRTSVQSFGADEAVILTPDGYVVEGAYSALLWWRGDILCGPPAEFDRVASVTARTVLTLAAAIGMDTHEEAVTPSELDGTELWALSALHGIRIATSWVGGPELAELPGRLASWRTRMVALRSEL
ncbi:branched-subunit amino acid aminotransferase/4-amino-4-deoxychorismate lyase [Microbacteriaceae bacterium SG_E_30_P1]|uniref:Branched-subunit amino acid aminotransferase/4-amino-4-deoxychorismate lyase n=1 Tax=Antiquaquibacter oligotrophicus TaxID=2880260 RepID=A0ABT6KMD8_9MICO|nr:aminotransferase class IV [Antiquaquibacter oligotrophicus]MDH6181168.1 branched-subunit amino acid aminotransferase/4-amino-4-deoxychorismate lyase [Antiquaquibacter oligotrophicus]UDF13136.1 aminotransferase class IV [Antiquaquibacter oligotrophicus]